MKKRTSLTNNNGIKRDSYAQVDIYRNKVQHLAQNFFESKLRYFIK